MIAANRHSGHVQLTCGVQAGTLWLPVAAANPDAVALLEFLKSTGASGGAHNVYLDGLLPDVAGPQGPDLPCQQACS